MKNLLLFSIVMLAIVGLFAQPLTVYGNEPPGNIHKKRTFELIQNCILDSGPTYIGKIDFTTWPVQGFQQAYTEMKIHFPTELSKCFVLFYTTPTLHSTTIKLVQDTHTCNFTLLPTQHDWACQFIDMGKTKPINIYVTLEYYLPDARGDLHPFQTYHLTQAISYNIP